MGALPTAMQDFGAGSETVHMAQGMRVFGTGPGRIAQELANRASAHGLRIEHLATREPSLEEVFVHITTKGAAGPVRNANV